MKKFLAIIMCAFIMCALPVVAFAEGEDSTPVDENTSMTDNLPTEDETLTEGDLEGEETMPEAEPTPEPTPTEPTKTITEMIGAWLEKNSGAIGIVCTIIGYGIALLKSIKKANKFVATTNNNSVAISENNSKIMVDALAGMQSMTSVVNGYKEEIATLLSEVRANAEEKQKLEAALIEVENYLKKAKLANVELADEVAELLVLANIPNSVKDELYARHLEARKAIADAENTEVKEDDTEEA